LSLVKGTSSTGVGASRDDTIVDVIHLLPRVAAGDELAVRECVDRYGPLIWALARRWSPDPRDAEDAVQEVFVDLWRSAGRYDATRATEAGWVAMVTRRRLIDRTRTATRLRPVARLPRGTRRHGGPAFMNQPANTPSDPHMPDEFEPTAHELLAGELTAAMLLDHQGTDDELPPALAARITATGEALVRARTVPPITATAAPAHRGRRSRTTWSGWLAAAALLAIVVRAPRPEAPSAGTPSAGTPSAGTPSAGTPGIVDPVAALRDSLLADSTLLRRSWTVTTDSAATSATGEVIWDARTQRGVMRFAGLAPNDRARWQYQLWIFDKARDERYPVDGGVFDIPANGGEVLVPIRARLPVGDAVLFAVTVEKPGGVVVSTRERIALLAKI
jgi:RNA polymerase sigma factor (sigma-70 family)